MSIIPYDELRKQSPKFAREMVRRVLLSNDGNVSWEKIYWLICLYQVPDCIFNNFMLYFNWYEKC